MPTAQISAYEQLRLDNIAKNRAALIALGLEADVEKMRAEVKASKPKPSVKGADQNKKRKADAVPPRQRSFRLQNLDADGKALPDKEAVPSPTTKKGELAAGSDDGAARRAL